MEAERKCMEDSLPVDTGAPVVIGRCSYCLSDLIRGISHMCDESEFEQAREPFHMIGTGKGVAIRDATGRCLGTLSFRSWMSDRAIAAAREKILLMFNGE